MFPAFAPLRYSARLLRLAVARTIGSHSKTTDVWVALRQRRRGVCGEAVPKVDKMEDWREANAEAASFSAR